MFLCQCLVQEYGDRIVLSQALGHFLPVGWVFEFNSGPAKPLELGRFG